MFRQQMKVEFRRHSVFFLGITLINIALILISLIPHFDMVGTYLYPLCQMVLFTLTVIYIFYDIYQDLYLGRNPLLLMIPFDTFKILLSKAAVYLSGFLLLWLGSLINLFFAQNGLYKTAIFRSADSAGGISYLFISRIAGACAGIGVLLLCVGAARFFRKKLASYLIVFLAFVAVMTGFCLLILYFNGCLSGNVNWAIGIFTNIHVYNQYFGFIPIMILPSGNASDIADTIDWRNPALNAAAACMMFLLTYLIFKFHPYDYVDK